MLKNGCYQPDDKVDFDDSKIPLFQNLTPISL